MYCKKCGKTTTGDNTLCDDCKAAEIGANKTNVSMLSFGKALASIIMGFGTFIVSCVLNSSGEQMHLVAMILMILIDIAAIVLAIFFGAKAIHTYSAFDASVKDRKPTPAFILGLIGVILAGIAAVMVLVFLLVELPQIVSYPYMLIA